jgi:transcriptional regulator with XRE-family HTH domain
MKDIKDLTKTSEYWMEKIQNDFFRLAWEYMNQQGLNQSELANKLGVSRGYISQILNGNFNFSLKKLIEISLALEAAPNIEFTNINEYSQSEEDRLTTINIHNSQVFNVNVPMRVTTYNDYVNPSFETSQPMHIKVA